MTFAFEQFSTRHIGPDQREREEMLKQTGAESLDDLIDQTIPARIRLKHPLNLPDRPQRIRIPPRPPRNREPQSNLQILHRPRL